MENKTLEEALMCQTFGTLLTGGVPILETINITADTHPYFSEGLKNVHDSIREGDTVSDPMKKQGELFSPFTYNLTSVGEETGNLDKALHSASNLLILAEKYNSKESDQDLKEIAFYRSFALLQDAGLPVLRSVRILEEATDYFSKEVLRKLGEDIERGYTASEAMSEHPNYFSPVIRNLVAAGETGGVFDIMLNNIANYLQTRYQVKNT